MISSLLLALVAALAQDQDRGPLDAHSSTIYQLATTDFIPNLPRSLKAGEIELSTHADWSSTFTQSPSLNYYETFHSRTALWLGIDDRMTVGVSQSVLGVGGGYMAHFINNFHETFGISSKRGEYPENKFLAQSYEHGPTMQLPARWFVGDLMLTLHCKIVEEDGYGLFFGSQYQLPTGGETCYYKHRGFGVGNYLYGYVDITEDLRLFAGGDFAYIGRGEVLWHELRPFQASVLVGADLRLVSWVSLITQLTAASGAARWESFSSWTWEAQLGFRFKLSDRVAFEFAATENVVNFDNSADFGLHTGLSVRF